MSLTKYLTLKPLHQCFSNELLLRAAQTRMSETDVCVNQTELQYIKQVNSTSSPKFDLMLQNLEAEELDMVITERSDRLMRMCQGGRRWRQGEPHL